MIIVYTNHGNYEFPEGVEMYPSPEGRLSISSKTGRIALFDEWLHAETYPQLTLGEGGGE